MPTSPPGAPERAAVTWRSVGLGSIIVATICAATPFNDYVVANTFMVGSYLPLVMVLVFFVLVVLVNGLLLRFARRAALHPRELAIILLMTLVACSIPSQGLLRSLIPSLVAPFRLSQANEVFWNAFVNLGLPQWLFPVESIADGRNSQIVEAFYNRVAPGDAIPYAAWIAPLAGWGVFVAAMLTTLVSLAWMVREQWGVNERLPFPLAQIEYSLIQAPEPGRCLNPLFASRSFWIAAGVVIVIHSMSALNMYNSKFPAISLSYDFTGLFTSEPLIYLPRPIKRATIFFTFIGVTYFIQSRTAFSMWSIFFLMQLGAFEQKWLHQTDITMAAWRDQHLGAAVVYVAGFVWIGRHYWREVVRGRPGYPRGALILALAGIAVMLGWLIFLKVSVWVAAMIVGCIVVAHLVTARLVAETGMCFIRSTITPTQIYTNLPATALSGRDVFFSGAFSMNGAPTTRESALGLTLHGLRTADLAGVDARRERWKIATVIAWTLLLGFVAGSWASLRCYYTYATPLSQPRAAEDPFINPHGLRVSPTEEIIDPFTKHAEKRFPRKTHSPWTHWSIGAGLTAVLQFAAWRLAWWPLVPVGYVVGTAQFIQVAWFSLFLGWLAKVLILRYGGAGLFQRSRPVFIGIIFGEALAAGFWLLVNLVLAFNGIDYEPVRFLPA